MSLALRIHLASREPKARAERAVMKTAQACSVREKGGVFDVVEEGCFVPVNAGHETSFFCLGKYHTL